MSANRQAITRRLCITAALIAANIVLARFLSFSVWNLKIGFGFVPVVLAAILLGPLAGAVTGAVGDFIGAIAFPIGPYFPGFTLTAFLTGFWYGLTLSKSRRLPAILAAVLVTEIFGSVLLNSLWISILYDTPFLALLPARLGQAALMGVAEIIVIPLLDRILPRIRRAVSL